MPRNFKCADIICDFCGFLAQVKTKRIKKPDEKIMRLLEAAWNPYKKRLDAEIIFPLYIVSVYNDKPMEIKFLDKESQRKHLDMFVPRKPLSNKAKRAGWQSFNYDLSNVSNDLQLIWKSS